MSGLAIKSNSIFVSKTKKIKRIPMNEENKKRREFVKKHTIIISLDEKTMNIIAHAEEIY